ncbi:MAG: glycoside hydrolase family 3 N-terminal domain-containing protein, partial [Dermatophilaceae bacterium]
MTPASPSGSMASASLAHDVAATLQPGFSGTTVPGWLARAGDHGLVSVCLYGDNTDDDGLATAAAAVRRVIPGVLLAADEEGGDVTRVHYPGGSPAVGNAVLGRLDDLDTTRAAAAAIGADVRALGIGLDFGPVVDVNSSPDNPVIGVRSFGADPALVARHASAWVAGLQATGVAACAKHFPGHGDTVVDSHHGLPRVDVPLEVLRDRELVPFRAAVAAGAAAVMTSHIVVQALDPDRPVTFSPRAIGVLRDELG